MSSIGKLDLEGPNLDKAREVETENILIELLNLGIIKFSPHNGEVDIPEVSEQISDDAIKMGERIKKRALARLGVDTIGKYINRTRSLKGFTEAELATKVKIAREAFSQLERDEMKFYNLTPQKAAKIVEVLELNIQLVVDFIKSSISSIDNSQPLTSFYRTKEPISPGEKSLTGQIDEAEIANRFLTSFLKEIKSLDHK